MADAELLTLEQIKEQRAAKVREAQQFARKASEWTKADTEKLYELDGEIGVFDRRIQIINTKE